MSQKTSFILTLLVKSFKSRLKLVLGVVTGVNFGPLVNSEAWCFAKEKEEKLMSLEAVVGVVAGDGCRSSFFENCLGRCFAGLDSGVSYGLNLTDCCFCLAVY